MGIISSMSGLSRAISSTGSIAGRYGNPMKFAAVNEIAPHLTGREMSELAADPSYTYDPAYTRIQQEAVTNAIAKAPGGLWRGTVKASFMLGTLPRLGAIMKGGTAAGSLIPMGLRTLLGGTKNRVGAGLWGFGAGTVATGSPLGGFFLGGAIGGVAQGKVFGKQIGAGGGGLLGIFGGTKAGKAVDKYMKGLFGPDPLEVSVTRTSRKMHLKKTKYTSVAFGPSGTEEFSAEWSKDAPDEILGRSKIRSKYKPFNWLTKDQSASMDRRLAEMATIRNGKEFTMRSSMREQLDDISREFGIDRRSIIAAKGKPMGSVLPAEKWDVPYVKGGVDVYGGTKYQPRGLEKIEVARRASIAMERGVMKHLTGGAPGILKYTPWGPLSFFKRMTNIDDVITMQTKAAAINDYADDAAKAFKADQAGRTYTVSDKIDPKSGRPVATEGTRKAGVKYTGTKKKAIREVTEDVVELGGKMPKTNMARAYAMSGLGMLSSYMTGMWAWGGIKKVGGAAVSTTLSTVKTVTSIARGIGSMEFGTGKTLDTRMASTERSRAITAMQNIGISARSYLGREASIMSEG